jgi:hypothetical protein
MEERWKDITFPRNGYESFLRVSDRGRVILPEKFIQNSWNGGRVRKEREARYSKLKNGYVRAAGMLIHRLVAELFVEKPKEYQPNWDVNHKDLDKENNNWDNLEWITHKENMHHYLKSDEALGTKLHPIEVHTSSGEFVGVFPSKSIAAKFCKMSKAMVGYVSEGRYDKSKGYVFKPITKEEYYAKKKDNS